MAAWQSTSKETSANAERYPLFSKETCCATLAPLRLFSKEAALCGGFTLLAVLSNEDSRFCALFGITASLRIYF